MTQRCNFEELLPPLGQGEQREEVGNIKTQKLEGGTPQSWLQDLWRGCAAWLTVFCEGREECVEAGSEKTPTAEIKVTAAVVLLTGTGRSKSYFSDSFSDLFRQCVTGIQQAKNFAGTEPQHHKVKHRRVRLKPGDDKWAQSCSTVVKDPHMCNFISSAIESCQCTYIISPKHVHPPKQK